MADVADPGCLVHGVADVAVVTGQPRPCGGDPHADGAALWPGVPGDRPLGGDGGGERRPRPREGDEERVGLAVDLDASVGGEDAAEELVVL